MKCLLCGSKRSKFKFIFKGRDIYLEKLGRNDFKLKWHECGYCGVYFSDQYEKIESVYDDASLYDAQYDATAIKTRFHKIMALNEDESDNTLRVQRVKSFHRRCLSETKGHKVSYRILDIGAGLGVFLAKFLDVDYEGLALEVNPVAANHIREELKIPVCLDIVQKAKIEKKLDLITMNKVIEHIQRPKPVLNAVANLLAENGIIYLELPDVRGYEVYGDTSDAFASGHYMVYNPTSVFYLLRRTDFELLSMDRLLEPSGKFTICAFARRRSA